MATVIVTMFNAKKHVELPLFIVMSNYQRVSGIKVFFFFFAVGVPSFVFGEKNTFRCPIYGGPLWKVIGN